MATESLVKNPALINAVFEHIYLGTNPDWKCSLITQIDSDYPDPSIIMRVVVGLTEPINPAKLQPTLKDHYCSLSTWFSALKLSAGSYYRRTKPDVWEQLEENDRLSDGFAYICIDGKTEFRLIDKS